MIKLKSAHKNTALLSATKQQTKGKQSKGKQS